MSHQHILFPGTPLLILRMFSYSMNNYNLVHVTTLIVIFFCFVLLLYVTDILNIFVSLSLTAWRMLCASLPA